VGAGVVAGADVVAPGNAAGPWPVVVAGRFGPQADTIVAIVRAEIQSKVRFMNILVRD